MKPATAYIVVKAIEAMAHTTIFSVYVLFLTSKGLSLLEANQINTLYMLVTFLFDPITGSLADKYGQRRVYLLGSFLWAIAMFVYAQGDAKWEFYLGETFGAFGTALVSEALESWLRNVVGVEKSHKTIAKAVTVGTIVAIPTAIVGSYVGVQFGLNVPFALSGLLMLMVVVTAVIVLPSGSVAMVTTKHWSSELVELWRNLHSSFRLVIDIPDLRFVVVVSVVYGMCFQPFNMFWSVIFRDLSGGKLEWLGLLWVGISLCTSLGAYLSGRRLPTRKAIGMWVFLTSVVMIPVGLVATLPIAVSGFLIHEITRGALRPSLGTYANRHIPDLIRSTASSMLSSVRFLGAILGLQISGFLTLILPPILVWTVSGICLLFLGLWAYFARNE